MKLTVTYLHQVPHKWKSNIPTIQQWTELFSETYKMQHKTQKYVWIIHRNVMEDLSYNSTPDFCNFFITFPHYSPARAAKPVILQLQLTGETAFSLLNWPPPCWTDQQCSAEMKMKLMLQLLFKNQKYGMLCHKIILKYGSCKHQENIHLVRNQILFTNPVNAFVHKLFKIMEILFAFGLVIIFTERDNRKDKHIC